MDPRRNKVTNYLRPFVIFRYFCLRMKFGDIILFHDNVYGTSPTAEALEIILPELIERGYSFVTVSELIAG